MLTSKVSDLCRRNNWDFSENGQHDYINLPGMKCGMKNENTLYSVE